MATELFADPLVFNTLIYPNLQELSILLNDNFPVFFRLKQKGERNPDFTKALIKEKLKDQDQEIATTSCKVTLACPLGKMRMNLPCRATTCDHLQCFDAALYLQMNEKKPKVAWKRVLPNCKKVYRFPVPSRDVASKLSLAGNYTIIPG